MMSSTGVLDLGRTSFTKTGLRQARLTVSFISHCSKSSMHEGALLLKLSGATYNRPCSLRRQRIG